MKQYANFPFRVCVNDHSIDSLLRLKTLHAAGRSRLVESRPTEKIKVNAAYGWWAQAGKPASFLADGTMKVLALASYPWRQRHSFSTTAICRAIGGRGITLSIHSSSIRSIQTTLSPEIMAANGAGFIRIVSETVSRSRRGAPAE